jgi:hypothetical protein
VFGHLYNWSLCLLPFLPINVCLARSAYWPLCKESKPLPFDNWMFVQLELSNRLDTCLVELSTHCRCCCLPFQLSLLYRCCLPAVQQASIFDLIGCLAFVSKLEVVAFMASMSGCSTLCEYIYCFWRCWMFCS